MSRLRVPRSLAARLALTVLLLGGVFALFWWRGPSFSAIGSAFTSVVWEWVVVAIAFNLLSIRRWRASGHAWRVPLMTLNSIVIVFLLVLIAIDVSRLVS